MRKFEVFVTGTFEKVFHSLDGVEKRWVLKTMFNLESSPRGKILVFDWFCEKKFRNKRLFYLVDKKLKRILLISFASKKSQQDMIDFVRENKEKLLKSLSSF